MVVHLALQHTINVRQGAERSAGKVSSSGNTIAFGLSVSRRASGDQFVLKGVGSGKRLFLTTVANDDSARGHRHLYKALSALMGSK
jgi:hypothetical protein